ncbi:hypothetical protein [Gordonia insulae]|uniref:Tissue inhibitor of metalloproteinase n=1 Tax=Gordonia insulae TaxID=2420509 RepID=A0A3G8JJ70_9ACTN|nr:hypothetical protein [Gordonia insulae]AZG45136.1 hypothetical protein D7316_01730 [Gordonia insulae]
MVMRTVLVLAAALGVLSLTPGTACACSCAARPTAAVIKDASAVVLGIPVSRVADGSAVRYRFEVRQSYKQRVPQTITVLTSSSSAACGVPLEIGAERLLVLGRTPGGVAAGQDDWGASLCENTADIGQADAVRYAGPSIQPYAADDSREPRPAVVGAFVALAALVAVPGGIMWWRVRQRRSRPEPQD